MALSLRILKTELALEKTGNVVNKANFWQAKNSLN